VRNIKGSFLSPAGSHRQPGSQRQLTHEVKAGGVWQVKFTRAGTYGFVCTFHAGSMTGLVEVTP